MHQYIAQSIDGLENPQLEKFTTCSTKVLPACKGLRPTVEFWSAWDRGACRALPAATLPTPGSDLKVQRPDKKQVLGGTRMQSGSRVQTCAYVYGNDSPPII